MENKKPAEAGFLLSAGNSTRDESTRSLLLTPARGVTQQPQAGQHHGVGFRFRYSRDGQTFHTHGYAVPVLGKCIGKTDGVKITLQLNNTVQLAVSSERSAGRAAKAATPPISAAGTQIVQIAAGRKRNVGPVKADQRNQRVVYRGRKRDGMGSCST